MLLVGCATPLKAAREDNRRLDTEVTELRDERRAQDRKLRDLQHQLDKLRADKVSAVIAQMPALPVEVVGPAAPASASNERVIGVTDDGMEIVYEGDAAAGKLAPAIDDDVTPRRTRRTDPVAMPDVPIVASGDRIEVTRRVPPISARVNRTPMRDRDSAPTERSDAASADYRAAVELVKSGDQTNAIAALRAFLVKFPRHDYADNAQYWLGEAFYAQKDYTHALAEFRNVIETYPRGNKVPDALLKVGFCYQAMGQGEKARAVLEQVVNLYPKTEPAALASKRLEGGT
jgi:tol-pal system protein YbgF